MKAQENVTIERRGPAFARRVSGELRLGKRKGRKERQYFSAAFAAFAFQRGVGSSDTLLPLARRVHCLRVAALFVIALAAAPGDLALAHDLERTQVSLTFARDGSFVLDVTNDLNWLKLRLASFASGRRDLAALGDVFVDRVVLFVDGHELRPTSAEFVPPAPLAASADAPVLATYRLRGRMPASAHTLRWYYGLVIDPYPLALHRADGRTINEEVYGDAWSRSLDISGQFDDPPWIPPPVARQLPIVIMVGVFAIVIGLRITRGGAVTTKDTKDQACRV